MGWDRGRCVWWFALIWGNSVNDSFIMPCGKHKGVRLSQLSDHVVACIYLAYSDPHLKISNDLRVDITNECMYDLKRRLGTYAAADTIVSKVREWYVNRKSSRPQKNHKNRKQPVKSHKKPPKRKKSNAEHLADFERDRVPYTMPNGITITVPAGTQISADEICPFA